MLIGVGDFCSYSEDMGENPRRLPSALFRQTSFQPPDCNSPMVIEYPLAVRMGFIVRTFSS